MDFRYQFGNDTFNIRIEKSGAGYAITLNGETHVVEADARAAGELTLLINGQRRTAHMAAEGARRWVALGGQTFVFTIPQAEKKTRRGKTDGHVREWLEAQMPGLVRQVLVRAGDEVAQGQTLLTLEAMKMEIRVSAPHAGMVEKVCVQEGETVARGQALIELQDAPP